MKAISQTQVPVTTATSTIALWILGGVFLAQFAAVAWAVGPGKGGRFSLAGGAGHGTIHHLGEIGEIGHPGSEFTGEFPSSPDSPPGGLPLPPGSTRFPDPAVVPPHSRGGSPETIPRELGGTGTSTPTGAIPDSLTPRNLASGSPDEPFYIVPASARIRNPEVLGTIQAAIKMREAGDTQGSLESLRRADSMQPNNPRILHEFATTYFHMGLRDKAHTYWERVHMMGDAGAGDYFALAEIHLGESETESGGDPIPSTVGTISVGDVVATRGTATRDGERVFLRIPIHSLPGTAIRPDQVAAYIYFFDIVGGNRIEQTTPRTEITQNWSSAPIDWGLPEPEILDVTYYQRPAPPAPGEPAPSARRYYGYVIRLFYENTLQDVLASPRTLIDFNAGGDDSNPMLDNSLFGGS